MHLPFSGNWPITQLFGANPQDYAKFGMNGHNGTDYGLPAGTPVLAAESGRVSLLNDPPGFGTYVEIVGAHKTVYAHLKSWAVSNGTIVNEGQVIGYSNNTGNSSGPHLHLGVKPLNPDRNNGYLGAIDPQPLLSQEGGNVPSSKDMVDETAVRLGYNLALDRDASPEEVKLWVGKVTQEKFDRELLASPEHNAKLEPWRKKFIAPGVADKKIADLRSALQEVLK